MEEPTRIEYIGDAILYLGDCLEILRALSDESVNCIVTSPPYWGLRDYGTGTWEGGRVECDHKETVARHDGGRVNTDGFHGSVASDSDKGAMNYREVCGKCGARRIDQQIGLESTPEEYVTKLVVIFREARRVLRSDGTCWVNMGDSYAGSGKAGNNPKYWDRHTEFGKKTGAHPERYGRAMFTPPPGLKHKDLVGIPWRLAFALQADGWYLRSDIIWAKPNPMPESVTDRPTKAHEYIFLLTKAARYFYDADAVREEHTAGNVQRQNTPDVKNQDGGGARGSFYAIGEHRFLNPLGRNRRTVWTIATQPFPEAHFATFPEKLVEPCILAGCPERTCPECGAPWERVVERGELVPDAAGYTPRGNNRGDSFVKNAMTPAGENQGHPNFHYERTTIGFRPTCSCARENTMSGTMLDPFCGAGTALLVALRLGRRAIGIELKPEYMDMTRKRIGNEAAQGKLRENQPRLPLEEPEQIKQMEFDDLTQMRKT